MLIFRLLLSQIPQLILPEPPISFTMPTPPKLGPEVKFEGSPNIIPNVSFLVLLMESLGF
jgi:hypothetical protein